MKITYAKAIYDDREKKAVLDVFESGWFSGGKYTTEFEEKLAKWWGVKYALAVNSGSSANFIAIQSLNLDKNLEVITPALAFPTTISSIIYHNLVPVYCESDDNLLIDLDSLEDLITSRTRALVFAHTLGNVVNMDEVMAFVEKYNLKLIEDCCDAVGSKWKGQKVGTFGDLATVSFYPAHHITTFGEGGAILTNNYKLYRECKSIRDWGRDCTCKYDESGCTTRFSNPPFDHKYYYTRLGMNLKMTEAQASFGIVQLDRLDDFIEKRKKNYDYLRKRINLRVVEKHSEADVSWFSLPIISDKPKEIMTSYLESQGIQTRAIFAGNITKHPAYRNKGKIRISLENTDKIMNNGFFVGLHPDLKRKELDYIIKKLNL